MEQNMNLRILRLRYSIPLSELAAASGLSRQYISQVELGETAPTALKLETAIDAIIVQRSARLNSLKRSFAACKGRLLQPTEGDCNE